MLPKPNRMQVTLTVCDSKCSYDRAGSTQECGESKNHFETFGLIGIQEPVIVCLKTVILYLLIHEGARTGATWSENGGRRR
jgi:hypothetical protein